MELKETEISEMVDELLEQLTLEEKCDLYAGRDFWHMRGVPRLGLPDVRVTDCGHGASLTGERDENGTCIPTGIGQASTWNRELIEEAGTILGIETREFGCGVLLGPMASIHRVPVGGRNYETYSEDPYLAGSLASALIRGIQSTGTGACIKGFTANNQQQFQAGLDVQMDERTLQEIYLPNFRIAVEENAPWAVMTAYNGLNGKHTSENDHIIKDILKGQWGYPGAVMSDWRGVHSTRSITAGLDLEMPGPGNYMRQDDYLAALTSGELSEEDLDDHARRMLTLLVKCREGEKIKQGPDKDARRTIARRVAEESLILLKNDDQVLPFNPDTVKKIAVIGPNAFQARLGGGGSASMGPAFQVSVLDAMEEQFGSDKEIVYAEGCGLLGSLGVMDGPFTCSYFLNTEVTGDPVLVQENRQVDYSWGWASPARGIPRNDYSIRWEADIVPNSDGVHEIGVVASGGGVRLFINNVLKIDLWEDPLEIPPFYLARKIVPVDLKRGRPVSVRLEYRKSRNPAAIRLEWTQPGVPCPIEQAAKIAAEADATIVCAGISNAFEGGTVDRKTLDLPGRQDELIRTVAEANPHTVVVLNSGTPLNVQPWINDVKAVINAWYPGQEGGSAVVHALFGRVNPSGKLPDTMPNNLLEIPAMKNYPGDGKSVQYDEGVFVGYRHYDTDKIVPAFPFGFGLSYTTFRYSEISFSADTLESGESLEVRIDVTNTGTVFGKEVVQLYIRDLEASVKRPFQELKGFDKIELNPGERKTVLFVIKETDLSFFDSACNCWKAEPGTFEVLCGTSSRQGVTDRFELK